jgi:predicted nucleotidyltransferase
MLAMNIIVNMIPNANAQVIENLGMYSALTRNPIMLAARKLVFSGAVAMLC